MQRFFDIVFSSIALLALSPVFILIMLILRFTGEGEVFFVQQRIGKDGKMFGLLKFATMIKNSPNIGNGTITAYNDPRVLPFGKSLRETKINELPQLLNILKGDMSIIGPRPMIESTFLSYSLDIQKKLTQVRPGLSGIGSIVFRNEERLIENIDMNKEEFFKRHIFPYKAELELWFIKNKSVYIYFILIFLTIWAVIFSESKFYKKVLFNLPQEPKVFR